jgi:restriction system protein
VRLFAKEMTRMFPPVLPPEQQLKLVDYLYARMMRPMRVRIVHEAGGNYSVYDEKDHVIQTGWIAEGGAREQRNISVMANLREASQVAIERPALQRLLDLMSFGETKPQVTLSGLIIPDRKTDEGVLISSISYAWIDIVEKLQGDWAKAHEIEAHVWEELIAAAYKRAGYDEVTLTPRSNDHGRDLIAVKKGVGAVKLLGSVKAFKPGSLVTKEQVHALVGVISLDPAATKGVLITTTDFAPRILGDKNLARAIPDRIELINGAQLKQWLSELLALPPPFESG